LLNNNVNINRGITVELNAYNQQQLSALKAELSQRYQSYQQQGLKLDLTRGKPNAEQLDLSNDLDGILAGDFLTHDGVDVRNYGGLEGIPEAREWGAMLLDVDKQDVWVGNNSSLHTMYAYMQFCHLFGARGAGTAWRDEGEIKFICPVPGYDRHFTICEALGIKMLPVPMNADGPDMDAVEALVKADSLIKGIWCVPKYSNPSGEIYSDAVIDRIAGLGKIAGANFRIFCDNAYAVHDLDDEPTALKNIMASCRAQSTEDSLFLTGSTSKITFAGGGISFVGFSQNNQQHFRAWLSSMMIGPDKVNQLRHTRFIKNKAELQGLMRQHAALLRPKFALVQTHLAALNGKKMGTWTDPKGGYFVSFDCLPHLAKEIICLTQEAGVKLTPAGATHPYGNDPDDKNIRIAPSYPSLDEIERAMPIFICAVELASVRQRLATF
jgi:aspartate/methionine/tyrosine aminotransferase